MLRAESTEENDTTDKIPGTMLVRLWLELNKQKDEEPDAEEDSRSILEIIASSGLPPEKAAGNAPRGINEAPERP
jgi:hypothetical protein